LINNEHVSDLDDQRCQSLKVSVWLCTNNTEANCLIKSDFFTIISAYSCFKLITNWFD